MKIADERRGLALLAEKDQRKSARNKKNTSHADVRRLKAQRGAKDFIVITRKSKEKTDLFVIVTRKKYMEKYFDIFAQAIYDRGDSFKHR